MVLLLHIFSGLTIWYWTTNYWSFPWGGLPLPLTPFLSYCWFSVQGWGLMGFSPIHVAMFIGIFTVQLMSGWLRWWDFTGIASDITGRHNFTENFLVLCPFFQCVPWALGEGMFVNCFVFGIYKYPMRFFFFSVLLWWFVITDIYLNTEISTCCSVYLGYQLVNLTYKHLLSTFVLSS